MIIFLYIYWLLINWLIPHHIKVKSYSLIKLKRINQILQCKTKGEYSDQKYELNVMYKLKLEILDDI